MASSLHQLLLQMFTLFLEADPEGRRGKWPWKRLHLSGLVKESRTVATAVMAGDPASRTVATAVTARDHPSQAQPVLNAILLTKGIPKPKTCDGGVTKGPSLPRTEGFPGM